MVVREVGLRVMTKHAIPAARRLREAIVFAYITPGTNPNLDMAYP